MDQDSTLPDAPPARLASSDIEDKSKLGGSYAMVQDPANANIKLEDLFDDDDDDDDEEFPSSGVSKEDVPSSSPPPSPP